MLRYNSTTIGKIKIRQQFGGIQQSFTVQIRQGNCLAVLIHVRKTTAEERQRNPEGKYIHTLYNFFADKQHLKNIMKDNPSIFYDDVTRIELNTYYKESLTLLKYFTKAGHKVTCYYKEPKQSRK